MLTLWDVGSRSRLRGPLYAGTRPWCSTSASARTERRSPRQSSDLGVKLWDVATGDSLDDPGFGASASGIAFSADGAMLASAPRAKGGAEVWDAATAHVDRRRSTVVAI